MNLKDIYTEIIQEHCSSTANRREIENPDACIDGVNPSCGDMLKICVKIKDGKIADAAYTGTGCAISQASASLMSELVIGKTVAEAEELVKLFLGMIKREITDDEQLEPLGDAIALKNISNMPARVKCAVLAWHTFENAVEKATGK